MVVKRFLLVAVFALCMVKGAEAAGVPPKARVTLGPVGGIVYADGTTVSDDEQYVVIFTADGYSFAGFTTNEAGIAVLAESAHSAAATYGTVSELRNGMEWLIGSASSVTNSFLIPLKCSNGVFELYLLDTRLPEGGFAPVDEEETFLPTTINAWAKATGSNAIKASALNYNQSKTSSGSITTTETTVIGTFVPVPVVVSFGLANGVASVGATNTVATAKYVLNKASDVKFENVLWTSESKAGAASATMPLVFEDANATNPAAFYRIDVVK